MFSGIIEEMGVVTGITSEISGITLAIELKTASPDLKPSDSVSVDGVCLTVVEIKGLSVTFNVMTETLSKTNLGSLKVGSATNIEASLRVGDQVHGHIVQGHVQGIGKVVKKVNREKDYKLYIEVPEELVKYIAPLGAIAVNGVSLTIASIEKNIFMVALIPTTLALTNLGLLKEGDSVNIETDMLARQIVHYLDHAHYRRSN